MKITAIRLERRLLELDPPFTAAWDPVPRRRFEATLVFVETDEGLTGVSSGDTMDGFEAFEHLFLGEDPLELERHVRVLATIAFHAGRYWPLEAALWDITGQARGVPVAQLFGSTADRLPVYASTGAAQSPDERAESALALREEGFRALKLRIDRDEGWRMPGDIRPALDLDVVRRTAEELREHTILWLEEPRPVWDVEGLSRVRAETGVTIAGGEMVRTTAESAAPGRFAARARGRRLRRRPRRPSPRATARAPRSRRDRRRPHLAPVDPRVRARARARRRLS